MDTVYLRAQPTKFLFPPHFDPSTHSVVPGTQQPPRLQKWHHQFPHPRGSCPTMVYLNLLMTYSRKLTAAGAMAIVLFQTM